ncbi:MAG: signal peptidase I [Myxococcales bacterium]|nr:signal peptidase I [Myxococcales bacterium]
MRNLLRALAWGAGILGVILGVLYAAVFDTWVVPGDEAMLRVALEPNIRPGDRILVKRGGTPRYHELVRCDDPEAPGRFVVGRLVGVGRDKVEINNERVIVNGKRNPSPRGCGTQVLTHPTTGQEAKLTCAVEDSGASEYNILVHPEHAESPRTASVEEGRAYLIGDNRHFHLDSRDFGTVAADSCHHIVFRLWGESYGESSRRFNFIW